MANNEKFRRLVSATVPIAEHKDFQKTLFIKLQEEGLPDVSTWASDLWSLQEAYGKILYSELSASILDENDDNKISYIKRNLSEISKYMNNEYTSKNITIDQNLFWLKYKDHCELALLQRNHYNITKSNIKSLVQEFAKPEIESVQKEITSQLIGLVSMFTALSFVIFGGTQMLGSILDNVKAATISRMICIGILWTICMSMLFYIFVWFIIKIMKPNETNIFTYKFKKLFWIYIGALMLLLVGFTILSFLCPELFAVI